MTSKRRNNKSTTPIRKADRESFLAMLEEQGGDCPSTDLRVRLGWTKQRFLEVRGVLSDLKTIEVHRGASARVELLGESKNILQPVQVSSREPQAEPDKLIGSVDAKDEEKLLNKLKLHNGMLSNPYLLEILKWDKDRYYRVRDGLIDQGLVERWKGRGGTVRLIVKSDPVTPSEKIEQLERIRETRYYNDLKIVIEQDWAQDQRIPSNRLVVEIVGLKGSKNTGGTWTRPDIVVIASNTYKYIPGRHLEIITFEVKLMDNLDITAVYEALSHRRAANRAYVLIYGPTDQVTAGQDRIEIVCDEAKRQGIGVIVSTSPRLYAEWDERVEPRRVDLDPERANTFIGAQLSSDGREKLLEWQSR